MASVQNNNSVKVFVSSATSNTGAAAIDHLLKSHSSVIIRAGVRDVSKANKRFANAVSATESKQRLSFSVLDVKGENDTQSVNQITNELKGFDSLILIPPQEGPHRLGVVKSYVDAAKAAGIKHIVFLSAPAASKPNLILGKNLHASEALIRASGIPSTALSAVFFYENHFGNAATIKSQGAWYNPSKGSVSAPQLSVSDIGEALANVAVAGPKLHANKVYTIVGDVRTWDEVAVAYTKAIGKAVKYVGVPDEAAINAMKAFLPEIVAKGIVELNRDFEAAKPGTYSTLELKTLLGHEPESFQQWVTNNAAAFK